jgi:hypothetical protein
MEARLVSAKEKPVRRKTKPKATPAMDRTASSGIDPDIRRQLVAREAYLFAERRGFAAGKEIEDWVAAEALVDSRLMRTQAA